MIFFLGVKLWCLEIFCVHLAAKWSLEQLFGILTLNEELRFVSIESRIEVG